jgi:hypothetical protein
MDESHFLRVQTHYHRDTCPTPYFPPTMHAPLHMHVGVHAYFDVLKLTHAPPPLHIYTPIHTFILEQVSQVLSKLWLCLVPLQLEATPSSFLPSGRGGLDALSKVPFSSHFQSPHTVAGGPRAMTSSS